MQPSSGLGPEGSPHAWYVEDWLPCVMTPLSTAHCCPCATLLAMEVSCTPTSLCISFSLPDSAHSPLFASLSHHLSRRPAAALRSAYACARGLKPFHSICTSLSLCFPAARSSSRSPSPRPRHARRTRPPPSGSLLVAGKAAEMLPNSSCGRGQWLSGWYHACKHVQHVAAAALAMLGGDHEARGEQCG